MYKADNFFGTVFVLFDRFHCLLKSAESINDPESIFIFDYLGILLLTFPIFLYLALL